MTRRPITAAPTTVSCSRYHSTARCDMWTPEAWVRAQESRSSIRAMGGGTVDPSLRREKRTRSGRADGTMYLLQEWRIMDVGPAPLLPRGCRGHLMRPISVMLAVAGLLCLAGGAQAAPADSLSYALTTPPSQLESGCQGPCDCAVQAVPTYGSFDLIRTGADGVYTYYEIHRYIASFNNGPGAVSLIGTGTYKIDSSAGMQEMTLDLEVWGEPEHFASGLVPVTVPFPELRAE